MKPLSCVAYFNKLLILTILFVIVNFSCIVNTAKAATLPLNPYNAHYKVYIKGCPVGESIHQLSFLSNGAYRFDTFTDPYLSLVPYRYIAKTLFKFENNTIIPQDYVYNSQELRRNKQGRVHFNWEIHQLENKNTDWEAPIYKNMQDKVSHSLQLRIDLLKGKREDLTYTVAEESKILPYSFEILCEETLKTAIGTLNTLKIKHIDKKNQITLTWLAIDYEYLPVKMEHYRKGKKVGNGEILSYNSK